MSSTDLRIEFKGFNPDYELASFITLIAEGMRRFAPSDAAMVVALEKGKGAIEASCRIASRAGIFIAESVSRKPVKAIKQIEASILAQLDEWKRSRTID